MILNYNYNKKRKQFILTYIKPNGGKGIMKWNIDRFKAFREDPCGKFINWNGHKCSQIMTDKPSKFDFLYFINELNDDKLNIIKAPNFPRLYVFDIEVQVDPYEFPAPEQAKFPIYTISIVNDKMDAVVLGTKELDDTGIEERIHNYLDKSEFWKKQNMAHPSFKYIKFDSEMEMLEYFLRNIVSKVPILSGWNSILFDWNYIVNRIKRCYPDLSLAMCDCEWQLEQKRFMDQRGRETNLPMPVHTWVNDMMDIIQTFDMTVMPIKSSMALDHVAKETIGMRKIQYDGDLEELYNTDYPKYIFYNAIDSILVQLLNIKFNTLKNLYSQALYCNNKIPASVSKIALTETLFWNYFHKNGVKVVTPERMEGERGELQGAYVAQPIPGKHKWVCCSDAASLYPSTINTCNISIENIVAKHVSEEEANKYRQDKRYFVSVNNNVYRNDKTYSFKAIQLELKQNRDKGKYLFKALDAQVVYDITHPGARSIDYSDIVVKGMQDLGFDVKCTGDLEAYDKQVLLDKLYPYISYWSSYEQACKYLGNGAYGASSNQHFAFFDIDLANDITGEARNFIHLMEKTIPEWFDNNWMDAKWLHDKLGVKVKGK